VLFDGGSEAVLEPGHHAGFGVVGVMAVQHPPSGLSALKSTVTVCIRRTIVVSLRAPLPSLVCIWKVRPCRCIGWHIIESLRGLGRV
jgi:hypothetical protein